MLKLKPLTLPWATRRRAPTRKNAATSGHPTGSAADAAGAAETPPPPEPGVVEIDAADGDPGENADRPPKDDAAKTGAGGTDAAGALATASVSAGESAAAAASNVGVAVVGPSGAAATSLVGAVCVGPGGAAATSNSANSCHVAIQADGGRASRT